MTATLVPEAVLDSAARLLGRRVGLRPDPSIRGRLARCVLDDARARDMEIALYVERLDHEPALLQSLLDRVTVQETAFFRDPNQFVALRDSVLPDINGPVTIWSAGCSNGQEAYSLAMTMADAGVADWRVTASDISTLALARTRDAQYTAHETRTLGVEDRARHFRQVGAEWRVVDALRARVHVVHHNLDADEPPFADAGCDIVFCRNVLIYFRPEHIVTFLDRLARRMRPGAWLFLGYSESLWQVTDRFQLVRIGDAFAYRLRAPGARAATSSGGTAPAKPLPVRSPARSARRPASPGRTRPMSPAPAPAAQVGTLASAGADALAGGDFAVAVASFRKWAYLDPDQPVAHLHLGLALEAGGDLPAAQRAYGAANRALSSSSASAVAAALGGYDVRELQRLLDAKLAVAQ